MTHTGFHGDMSFGVRSSISSSVCTHSSRLTMQSLHPVSTLTPPNTQDLLNLTLSTGLQDEKLKPPLAKQEIRNYIIHRDLRLCYRSPRPKEAMLALKTIHELFHHMAELQSAVKTHVATVITHHRITLQHTPRFILFCSINLQHLYFSPSYSK